MTAASLAAIVGGAVVAVGLFLAARHYEQRALQMKFEGAMSDRVAAIQLELDEHLWMLASLRALWDGTGGVDREQFAQMVGPLLEQYSALTALEWVPVVTDAQRERVEAGARMDGIDGFRITERDATGALVTAGRRPVYYPVLYAEPAELNDAAFGYDLGSHAERLETLLLASSLDEQQTTAPIDLVQDPGGQGPAFLTLLPVYTPGQPHTNESERRDNLEGFAVAVFRADEIFDRVIDVMTPLPVAWRVQDETGDEPLLVWADPPDAVGAGAGEWRLDTLDAGGHEWTVRYRPLDSALLSASSLPSWFLLGVGLLLTVLLAVHLYSVDARSRDLAATNIELSELILERERAEHRQLEAQRTLATLMSNLPGLAYRCRNDRDWTMEFLSDGCLELTGYHPDQLLSGAVSFGNQLIHETDRERVWELIQFAIEDERPFQLVYRIVREDLEERWVWEQGRGIHAKDGSLIALEGFITDISVQKRVEQSLTKEKRFSDSVIDSLPGVFYLFTAEGRYLRWNKNLERVSGYTSTEIGQMQPIQFIPEDEHERVGAAIEETFRDGASAVEAALLARDGTSIPYFFTGRRVTLDGTVCLVGMGVDIADRKRAEADLVRERRMFIGGPAVVVSWQASEGWPVEYISPNVTALFGYSAKDFMTGRVRYRDVVHPDDLERVAETAREHRARGDESYEQDYRIVHADGSVRWLYDFTVVERNDEGVVTHHEGYVLDITERRRAEEEREEILKKVLDTQKLESVGILAGGIAHDFNNLLTSVIGNLDFALDRLPADSAAQDFIGRARVASNRASDLTQQLLAYAGRASFEREPIDLSEHIREITHLLNTSIPKKVALELDLAEELPAVDADAAQIQQLVMNLVINGAEACGEAPGAVRVRTSVRELAEPHVVIEVRDSGCGMNEETRRRIFDPFFTTKFTGRGLGLAAALGIVRGHGGTLGVQSAQGEGSTFEVVLPASTHLPVKRPTAAKEDLSGTGTILIADDEPAVLRVASRTLEERGYRVLLAEDGRRAVELFRSRPDDIALVLLDLTMPEMNGAEAFRAIRELREDVLAVLSSGWNEEEATSQFVGTGLAGFLQKPYTPEQLAAKVKEALARR
jgi:PAS domain S-box-containing protein